MLSFYTGLRSLVGLDDRATAFRREEETLSRATTIQRVDPGFAHEMSDFARRPGDSIVLGTSVGAPELSVRAPLRELAGLGHALVLGTTGAGKTRVVAGVAARMLRRIARAPRSLGLCVLDHKGDLVSLVRALLGDLVDTLPPREAERLLDMFVVVDPFSTEALVPLQILFPEAGVAPAVQAFETTSLLNRLGGAELGVRQDAFLFHAVLLGITRGVSLPELAGLLRDPAALASAAESSASPEVRAFFRDGPRVAASSLDGVSARLSRLLRLPSARLMLGARSTVSFHRLLGEKIALFDVGSPPLGCEDLGRFWAGLFTLKLTRAIFERTPEEASRPVAMFIDEWQEGLAASGDMADHFERVLAMARSRGVSLWLISQSLAGAQKVSSTLPSVVQTNTTRQLLFKASAEDAARLGMLPVTGRRQRPAALPWEERPRSPFLSTQDERELLVREVVSLPQRVFLYWNRDRPYQAELVRAGEVEVGGYTLRSASVARRLRVGSMAVPIRDLEAQAAPAAEAEVVFRPRQASAPLPLERPTRRPRRRGA
jgi:hypothetical protein